MPVLLWTTKYYSGTSLCYKVLLCTTQYYASTTLYYPVLQRTTLYYKVLRQYYSVLQSTTTSYSSTTLYYKVLLQYYSVLQSTTPVLLCTTKYYASTTLYYASTTTYYSGTTLKRHLQCAEQVKSPFKLSKYCSCHAKWKASFIRITYETSFPMRGASKVTLQSHQILRLPRKVNVINDLRHIWNVISNAWSKSSHLPTSPNTAPARKMNGINDLRHIWNLISNKWSK